MYHFSKTSFPITKSVKMPNRKMKEVIEFAYHTRTKNIFNSKSSY